MHPLTKGSTQTWKSTFVRERGAIFAIMLCSLNDNMSCHAHINPEVQMCRVPRHLKPKWKQLIGKLTQAKTATDPNRTQGAEETLALWLHHTGGCCDLRLFLCRRGQSSQSPIEGGCSRLSATSRPLNRSSRRTDKSLEEEQQLPRASPQSPSII